MLNHIGEAPELEYVRVERLFMRDGLQTRDLVALKLFVQGEKYDNGM